MPSLSATPALDRLVHTMQCTNLRGKRKKENAALGRKENSEATLVTKATWKNLSGKKHLFRRTWIHEVKMFEGKRCQDSSD